MKKYGNNTSCFLTQETYKNGEASLMGAITVSPRHGAQDVSLTPFTHTLFILSLLLPDTARRSACTRFVQTFPISELVLIFCFRCGSSQTRTHPTGASIVVAFVSSAPSSVMSAVIFLRVGPRLDATR